MSLFVCSIFPSHFRGRFDNLRPLCLLYRRLEALVYATVVLLFSAMKALNYEKESKNETIEIT